MSFLNNNIGIIITNISNLLIVKHFKHFISYSLSVVIHGKIDIFSSKLLHKVLHYLKTHIKASKGLQRKR